MEVFISWSGKRSLAAAEALRDWLPKVIQAIDPWLSKTDIEKGTEWNSVIAGRLARAKAGIFCLTTGNLHADSILFEAGAISRNGAETYVCTLLIGGLEYSQIQWPLSQFQHTKFEKADVSALLQTLNKKTEKPLSDADLEDVFETYWPRLDEKFGKLPSESGPQAPKPSVDMMVAEILELVRDFSRPKVNIPSPEFDLSPLAASTVANLKGQISKQVEDEFLRQLLVRKLEPFEPKAIARLERVGERRMMTVVVGNGKVSRFDVPDTIGNNNLLRDMWLNDVARSIREDSDKH